MNLYSSCYADLALFIDLQIHALRMQLEQAGRVNQALEASLEAADEIRHHQVPAAHWFQICSIIFTRQSLQGTEEGKAARELRPLFRRL
jgi:hypothetical protein